MATISDNVTHHMNELKLIRKILTNEIKIVNCSVQEIYEQLNDNGIPRETYSGLRMHDITQEHMIYLQQLIENNH